MSDNKDALDFFSQLIEKEIGIRYRQENYYQLEKRLKDTARQIDAEDVKDLLNQVRSGKNPMAKMLVLDAATNNETSFFRDKRVFDAFKDEFLPSFTASGKKDLKIWSTAASTGQEIYSLAMTLEDYKSTKPDFNYSIYATDISGRVLSRCKEAEYSQLEVQRGMPAPLLIKWFEKVEKPSPIVGDTTTFWKIKSSLQRNVQFDEQNLLQPFLHQGPFDIVFCRNVLIYFEVNVKQEIISKISRTLTPGGMLVLGASESMIGLSDDFQIRKLGSASYYEKKDDALYKAS